MKRFFLVIIVFFISVSTGSNEKEINAQKDKISDLRIKEKSLIGKLDETLRNISIIDEEISRIKEEIKIIDRRIGDIKKEKSIIEKKLSDNREKQKEIIKNLYFSKTNDLSILVGMNFRPEYRSNKVYLRSLSKYRRDIIEHTIALNDSMSTLISREKDLKKRNEELIAANNISRNNLKSEEKEQKKLISGIKSKKAEFEKALKELEEEARKIARLQSASSSPQQSGSFPRKIPWPTKSTKILNKFGMTKENTFGTHFYNPGIDIKAEPREKVYVVSDGYVNYVGWLRGYGNIIIVRHPDDYYTLYGNLENLAVDKGMYVKKGQLLGEVSPYGWLEGAKLHFEIRKGKKELDPLKWLDKNIKII